MPATLKLQGGMSADLDLSTYLNAVEGEGLDPAPGGFLDPQFTDSSVGDGQGLVNINERNSESVWPLHLRAASKDALHTLVQTLRRKLSEPGVRVEWRDDGATLSTFRDLEFGRWEPGYRYHRARHFMLSGSLRCWAEPYGHTGTYRSVASSGGTAPFARLSVASVAGDAEGLTRFTLSAASVGQVSRWAIISLLPTSSVLALYGAASMASSFPILGTLIGSSAVQASQYRAYAVPTSGLDALSKISVPSEDVKGVPHRVFAVAQTMHKQGAALRVTEELTASETFISGPTAVVTSIASSGRWTLLDLGRLDVPSSVPSGVILLSIDGGGLASGAIAGQPTQGLHATYPLRLNWVAVLPEQDTLVVPLNPIAYSATYQFNDNAGFGVGPGAYDDFSSVMRGQAPALKPGNNTLLVGLAPKDNIASSDAGAVTNWSAGAEVRVRERFTFQR